MTRGETTIIVGLCTAWLFILLWGLSHHHYHNDNTVMSGCVGDCGRIFTFDDDVWWDPSFTKSFSESLRGTEKWKLGERWYAIRDLMGRRI